MINAQSSFIPLFFDEAETDLWLALQQIEPEERSSFIKSILRQALLRDRTEELIIKEMQNPESGVPVEAKNSELSDKTLPTDSPEDGLESAGLFSLDVLFEVTIPEQDMDNQPIHPTGFEYMMKHIIGTEEDEAVLAVLRGFPSKKR